MSNKSSETLDKYCCVKQCRNYKNTYAKMDLYPLPADLMRRETFCKILGIPKYVGSNPAARVCALHFKSKVGSYRPSPPTVPQAIFAQPVTLMIQDGRHHLKPILPRIQPASFPAPVQQPITLQQSSTLQQPVTFTFNPRPATNVQQNEPPKEPPNDISIDKVLEEDLIKNDDTSCNSSDITLQLECEEDLLSTTQLNAYMKDLMDFVNANELVYKLPPPEPKGCISPLLASNNSASDELPPLEPIFKNTSILSNPTNLSSSIPNSQFLKMYSPSNKGIGVVSNSLSLFKNVNSNSTKVETVTTSSSACPPLFVHSPALTSRTVSNTVSDKNSAVISINGKQLSSSSSFGASLSANGLVSRCGQTSTTTASNAAVSILSNMKLNSSASGSSSQTATTSFLPVTSNGNLFPNLSPLTNSISASTVTKNPSGIQANSVYQILPEKYKIVNAVSNNTAIPVMLLKALDFNDTGQSFLKNTTSASDSPVTIFGTDPDEIESCAASLCDVTLSESPEQMLVSQEQMISSNDLSTMYNQANGNSIDKFSIHEEVEPPVGAEDSQPSCNNINDQIGPVIVDVISAKEGATEYFNGNTIPNILFDNSKKAEDSNDVSYNNQLDVSVKPNPEKVINNKVDKKLPITNKDTIFNLQRSIPVIPNGHLVCSEPLNLLKIRTPLPIKRLEEAENLRKKLQQENFIPWAVWWLVQRRYMPPIQPCELCGSKKFIVDKNNNFPDGFCYTCANTNCPIQKPIKRPDFFERFKFYSIRDLLLLTYHWACQSSYEEITQDVNMECVRIWYYFKALQELCHQVAVKKGKLGLTPYSTVETSVVKMGDYFILGAMDRKTRYVRLEVLTEFEAYKSSRHICLLEQWINKQGTIISENQLPDTCLLNVQKVASDPTVIVDPNRPLPHTLNISKYLSKNMTTIFGMVNQKTLKKNDVQGFLYELQWRVKYGKFVDMSFFSILNHIREQNAEECSLVQIRKGEFSCDLYNMEVNNAFNVRWGPNLEDGEKNSEDHEPKLSGRDTKSYSKESNGCFDDYFHDIPEIVGGCSMVTSKSLLAVKIRFGETPNTLNFYKSDAVCLGLKLKSEGFITNPINWLVKKHFIKDTSTCYVCQDVALLKASTRFSDGCSWLCQNEKCKFENVFKRPSFFARFPQYPMSHIAGLIFHWIVQSDESLINTDIPIDACKILDVFRAFQGICSLALKRRKEKIGGEEHIVEVAVVRFGKLTILGAMDRKTKRPLLQAFPAEMGKIDNIYYTLNSWIHPKSIIVVDATHKFQMQHKFNCYKIFLANTNVVDSSNHSCHVLNIKYYLLNHITKMFCDIKPELMRQEVMQSYLEELMWRDHYGKQPQQAFIWMMNEIFYTDLKGKPDFLKEKKEPEFIPITFKELRVVLRRIPKSVLKFYGCEIPDLSKTSERTNSTISEEEPSSSTLDASDDIQVIEDSVQYSDEETVKNDDEVIILDEESPSSISKNKEIVLEQSPTSEPLDVCESTSSSTFNEICTNKVQPLVIKMHKKRKKFRSYLKSELEKVKKLELEKGLQNGVSDIPNSAVRTEKGLQNVISDIPNTTVRTDLDEPECDMMELPDIISSDSSHSNTWDTQSIDSTKSCKKVTRTHSARHSSSVQKEKAPKCIECGETVGSSYDHFSKMFNCTDCKKNSVYMTCCSKAFFEHRGSILFGKRMPRRMKEDYGLHRPIIMQHPWHCACGFNSKNGNKLASHMLKCRKRTCYYHQNVL